MHTAEARKNLRISMLSLIITRLAASCLFAFLNISRLLVTVRGLSPVKQLDTFGTLMTSLGKLTYRKQTNLDLGDGTVCKLLTLYT